MQRTNLTGHAQVGSNNTCFIFTDTVKDAFIDLMRDLQEIAMAVTTNIYDSSFDNLTTSFVAPAITGLLNSIEQGLGSNQYGLVDEACYMMLSLTPCTRCTLSAF